MIFLISSLKFVLALRRKFCCPWEIFVALLAPALPYAVTRGRHIYLRAGVVIVLVAESGQVAGALCRGPSPASMVTGVDE